MSTAILGTLSSVPLIARVLAPRRYGQLREALNRAFFPEPRTEVTVMRNDEESKHAVEGLLLGFAIQEKADRVAGVLKPAGLTKQSSRLVVVLGHGSTSLNNPHESAHDCGACGGRRGEPNARLFAAMANHPEVRKELAARHRHYKQHLVRGRLSRYLQATISSFLIPPRCPLRITRTLPPFADLSIWPAPARPTNGRGALNPAQPIPMPPARCGMSKNGPNIWPSRGPSRATAPTRFPSSAAGK